MITFPFEVPYDELEANLEEYVSAVFSCLESEFLVLPKGDGFIDYAVFETGYEALKKTTSDFAQVSPEQLLELVTSKPISLVVIRSILGFTPSEWGYLTTQRKGIQVTQSFARTLDRKVRMQPLLPLRGGGTGRERLKAMIEVACEIMKQGCPEVG